MNLLSLPPFATLRNVDVGQIKIQTNVRELPLQLLVHQWRQKGHPQNRESLINYINHRAGRGYRAAVPMSHLPRGHYRRVRAINNTQLGQLAAELRGERVELPDRALVLGSAFHCRILEPERYVDANYCLWPSEAELLERMVAAFRAHPIASQIHRTECELPIYWKDAVTGLPCKALIDNACGGRLIRDLKTTFAATEAEFRERCRSYDYDRQLVGYARGFSRVGGRSIEAIELVGVQKRPPFRIFVYQSRPTSAFWQSGARKLDHLLAEWQRQGRRIGR